MPTELDELRNQIHHPFIRERRKAIVRLAELMQVEACRNEARALLQDRADNDEIQNMRTLARSVLEYYQQRHPAEPIGSQDDRRHIFAASCPHCQHINYYDKREVARHRTVVMGENDGLDEVLLECTHCGKQLVVRVDLEGYK